MAKKSPHSLDRVLAAAGKPWAIDHEAMQKIVAVLALRLRGGPGAIDTSTLQPRPPAESTIDGGTAIIPLHGVIAPRMNLLSDISGGTTFEGARLALGEALAAGVSTIVLDIDSCGGSVTFAHEFAEALWAARDRAQILACANGDCCSAAYWAAAGAHRIIATPSAMVGSLGVYTIHEDLSKMLGDLGVATKYIAAGKFKVESNETSPLSPAAEAHLQSIVDEIFGVFMGDVARGRGRTVDAVISGYAEGRTVTAARALALGMVDEIATFDTVIGRLTAPTLSARARADAVAPDPRETHEPPALAATVTRARQDRELEDALLTLRF